MASGWPLSESAARRQRRKRRSAEICTGRMCYSGPLGLGKLPDPGWMWWGHQAEETQSHIHCQSFAQDTTSLRDEFLEHVRQTFSEALKLVKAELVFEVGECQVGASATPGVDEVLLAAEEDAVGVVAVPLPWFEPRWTRAPLCRSRSSIASSPVTWWRCLACRAPGI